MSERYGFRIDIREPNPEKKVSYLPDCDNGDWSPEDSRWNDSFILKGMHPQKDSFGQGFVSFPIIYMKEDANGDYREYRMSDEEFPGSEIWKTGAGNIISIVDQVIHDLIGVMIFKRMDWKDHILYYRRAEALTKIVDDYFPEYSGKLSPAEVSEILRRKYGNMKVKRLTAAQRMTLKMNGIPNSEMKDWYYVKTETESVTGSKASSKNNDKTRYMVIQNVTTNEIRRIEI